MSNQPPQIPQPPREIYTVPVEGSFECSACGEYVESAILIPEDRVLTWKCSKGHKTFIDKVNL